MKLKILVAAVVAVSVSSCTMNSYQMAKSGQERAREIIDNTPTWDRSAAVYTSTPTPDLTPMKAVEGPKWLNMPLKNRIQVSQIPFDIAVDMILDGTGVLPHFDYDMNHNLLVSLDASGTVNDALKKLASRTNYAFDAKEDALNWHLYVTNDYQLPVSGGDYTYMIGKTDQGGGSTGGGAGGMQNTMDSSAFDVDLKQYSNTTASKLNYFDDAEKTLQAIVGDFGLVIASRSTSSLMVKTTPDRMREVDQYMGKMIDGLTVQVALDIRVVQVTTHNTGDTGLNWSAVKQKTNAELNFVGETAQNLFTNSIPIGFSRKSTSSSGTVDILVNALEQQGNVSFATSQHILARDGKVSELEIADIKGYLQSSKVTSSTDLGNSQELLPGIVQGGYTLYSYTKVFGDRVALVVSSRSSDLDPFEKVGTEENFIQIPSMRSNRMNVNQIVRDGTTVVAASVRRVKSSSESSSPLSAKYLPTYAGSGVETTDIYILVTPRIIRNL